MHAEERQAPQTAPTSTLTTTHRRARHCVHVSTGGLSTGYRTKNGKAVEAGQKGFWYQ